MLDHLVILFKFVRHHQTIFHGCTIASPATNAEVFKSLHTLANTFAFL